MTRLSTTTFLQGGLDVVTPAMMIKQGFAISSLNYESEVRGYRRMQGYERFDGQRPPSAPDYAEISYIDGETAIEAGDAITGGTSGATATALYNADIFSGALADDDAAGSIVLYLLTGTFVSGENLQVSSSTVAVSSSVSFKNAASNDADEATYIEAVTAAHRALIAKPSGSGPVRGVATYRGDTYCWRDNAGGTAGVMFKATSAGWSAQSFGHIILFDAATAVFTEGETLTGASSSSTATIERVVLNGGAWDGSGVGYLVLSSRSGAYTNDETIASAGGSADANGVSSAITLPAGGTYRHITSNFYAIESFERLYFVNGVGRACEWDGAVLAPIRTGLPDALDKPTHVGVQKFHLFLSIAGGSLQYSGIGLPLVFGALQGAGEIGFGQTITGIRSEYRDTMILAGRNKIGYILGTSAANFDMKTVSLDSGAVENTLEIIGKPIFLDDQGLRDMEAVQNFGDWKMGAISQLVEPLFSNKRDLGITPVSSIRVRARDQYRIVYSDGSGFTVYFGKKGQEIMPFQLGFIPHAMHSGEASNGNEILLAAGADGFVYQIDRGTSFDGENIEAFLRLAFDHQGSPNVEKRYHSARLEGKAGGTTSNISVSADYSYGAPDQFSAIENNFVFQGQGGFLNESEWNRFQWSASIEGQAFTDLSGIGENTSIVFISDTATEEPHTLSTLTIFYSQRRKLK